MSAGSQTRTLKWRLAAGALVALALLNSSLAFVNVWPTPKIRWGNAISIELVVCVLLLAIAHRWAETLARRVLPALWVILVVGHYLDVTAPGLYGREFNLYWDSQHLGNVTAMLSRAAPTWLILVAAASVLAVFVALFVVARIALGWLASAMEWPLARRALGAAAVLLLVIFGAQQLSAQPAAAVPFADAVTPAYARQARFVLAMVGPGAVAPRLGPTPALDNSLARLEGADVLLLFVESYGAVTYETPAIADGLVQSRADLRSAVVETDREVITAYVESPTFGGSSWLAHLSLISGVEVRDQYAYTSLMASSRETMITNFSRRGYRTVALMPGMRQAWPEGEFYHYDQIYGRDLLDYRGPQFGWWSIPDQYALAKIDALERNRLTRKPVFIVFPTSTTHAPFGPVAPYQPDWSRMLASDAWAKADVDRSMAAVPDLTNLRPSYTHAMSYEYATIAGYLRQHPRDNMVIVALGDHQPPAAVSGRGAPWSVPVHVFGRRGPILNRLIEDGFREGLDPRRPPIGPMHMLMPMLLEAFSGPTSEAPGRLATQSPVASARQYQPRTTTPATPE
jgi:sulfatase-like protein